MIVHELIRHVTDFFTSQTFGTSDLAVILLLTILEGVLSIDNALVLGLLAKRLPKEMQAKALNWGMIGAFVFRFIAIFTASLLLRWTIVKFLGGAYLVYIAVRHLFFESTEKHEEKLSLDESGNPQLLEPTGEELTEAEAEVEIRERVPVYVKPQTLRRVGVANFWPTVVSIALTDIAFAVDSILAAIALVGGPPKDADAFHPKLWVVFTGAGLGMIVLRFAAGLFIKLMERFPRFEISAYLLVAVIGLKLLGDWGLNSDWSFDEPKWMASRLGGWKQSFESFEQTRRGWALGYEKWLADNWILAIPHHEPPPGGEPAAGGGFRHVPHVLDFHDLRRPESITFWLLMIVCFCTGFLPPRKKSPG